MWAGLPLAPPTQWERAINTDYTKENNIKSKNSSPGIILSPCLSVFLPVFQQLFQVGTFGWTQSLNASD